MTPLASKFWETASSGVAQKWLDRLLSPALLFWLGGTAAYSYGHNVNLIDDFTALSQVNQAITVVTALLGISGTTAAAELIEFRGLRYLEGYWPRWWSKMRDAMIDRHRSAVDSIEQRWTELKAKYPDFSPEEVKEYSALDRERARYPRDKTLIMPTRLGNVMRAAETYSQRRYGLAAALFWPRLWLHISDESRKEVTQAQLLLMSRVRVVVLGLLFCAFGAWAWWAPVVGLGVAGFAYLSALAAAVPFGDLVRSVFDLNHRSLVKAIVGQEPLGEHPMNKATGEALTLFLHRGKRTVEEQAS